jgi:response regulator NasT
MRIIVAEDDTITLSVLSDSLRQAGHEVLAAHDGEEALLLARESCPDAMIVDEKMPKRTGLDVAREVRRERVLPVVLVTAYNDAATRAGAVAAGVHGFLVKPVGGAEVIAALEVAAGAAERERELQAEADRARVALEERKLIERAKGILMRKSGISEEEAYRRIQQSSRDRNLRMVEIARSILEADGMMRGDA